MGNLVKLSELLDMNLPEPQFLVEKLIPEQAITIVSGSAGSYKSYACLDMAKAIASGEPAFGHFATRQTNVMYIDEENGLTLLKKRANQLNTGRNLNIYFRSYEGFIVNEESVAELILECQDKNIGLVIFDSFVRVNRGDENKSGDSSKFFELIRRIVYKGISVVLIHHNRKSNGVDSGAGNEMRGSSDILAAVDTHMGFKRAKNRITVTQTKMRYELEIEPFWLKVEGGDNEVELNYQGELNENDGCLEDSHIMAVLAEGELSKKDLEQTLKARNIKVNEKSLGTLLKVMRDEGLVDYKSGSGNTHLYYLKQLENDDNEISMEELDSVIAAGKDFNYQSRKSAQH